MRHSFILLIALSFAFISSYESARIKNKKTNNNQQKKQTRVQKQKQKRSQQSEENSFEDIQESKEQNSKVQGNKMKLRNGTIINNTIALKKNQTKQKQKNEPKRKAQKTISKSDSELIKKLQQLKSFDSITYLNVGQGNGIIAKTKDEIFVFDLGTTSKMYLQEIINYENSPQNLQQKIQKEIGDKKVQFFLTHNDYDHYSLKGLVKIKNFHVSPYVKVRQPIIYPKLTIVQSQTAYYNRVLVLNSPNIQHGTTNDNSVIFVIKVQNKVFLLTGDATARTIGMSRSCQEFTNKESKNELKTLQALRELAPHIDFFTYPHHGTQTDGSYCVFEEVAKIQKNLEGVIISAGVQRIYKHPSQDAIERVKQYFEDKKNRTKKYQRFQYFQSASTEYLEDTQHFKHILNKEASNILLGFTNLPLYITASLGDIVYDKKGISYTHQYDCNLQWKLVQYENIDILNSSKKINKKYLSLLQKNVCGYIMCYSSLQVSQNYQVLYKDTKQDFSYRGNVEQIKLEFEEHQQTCDMKNNKNYI